MSDLTERLNVLRSEQEERLAQHRADQLEKGYVNLTAYPINSENLALITKGEAAAAQTVVFYKQGRDVRLGAINPASARVKEIAERLNKKLGEMPEVYVISQRSLKSALARYASPRVADTPQDEMVIEERPNQQTAALGDLGERIKNLPPTEILTAMVRGGAQAGASDIHVEPMETEARLRYRIDGVLQNVATFKKQGWQLILSRVKVLAKLKLNVKDVPQDGSFVLRLENETYDMRVSILPGGFGETIVIRLLARSTRAMKMTELGMKKRDYLVMEEELKKANGMILVTGPTGSGKTTTLASFIEEVNKPELKIITLEDPIEYRIRGVAQTQVDVDAGYTFAAGLRSILRQDPDVIMVGEMRDKETVATATQAALTGHLVFSTLHTNNAAGAVPRLVNLGAKPFVLAPALNVVVAQRLVRVVCRACAEKYKPDAALRERIAEVMQGVRRDVFDAAILRKPSLEFYKAKGCAECNRTGYKGRQGVFEIFKVQNEIEQLVEEGADERRIRKAALAQGMTLIAQDAFMKVIEGVTTVEEVERISEE